MTTEHESIDTMLLAISNIDHAELSLHTKKPIKLSLDIWYELGDDYVKFYNDGTPGKTKFETRPIKDTWIQYGTCEEQRQLYQSHTEHTGGRG